MMFCACLTFLIVGMSKAKNNRCKFDRTGCCALSHVEPMPSYSAHNILFRGEPLRRENGLNHKGLAAKSLREAMRRATKLCSALPLWLAK
jgi:hypothetical protein